MKDATLTFRDAKDKVISRHKVSSKTTLEQIINLHGEEKHMSCDVEFEDEKYFDRLNISYQEGFLSAKYEVFPPSLSFAYYFDIDEFLENTFTKGQRQNIAQLVSKELTLRADSLRAIFDTGEIGIAVASDDMSPFAELNQNTVVAFFIDEDYAMLTVKITSIAVGTDEQLRKRFNLSIEGLINDIRSMDKVIDDIVVNVKGKL
jgi:hypothetical protein